MTTRERNNYLIGRPWRGACLIAVMALFVLTPASALAQCEEVEGGSVGDEYCEALPGAGGSQGAAERRVNPGVPGPTKRSLEQEGAGAVTQVESPRRNRAQAAEKTSYVNPKAGAIEGGKADDGTSLPYILGVLTLVLLGGLALRRWTARSTDNTAG